MIADPIRHREQIKSANKSESFFTRMTCTAHRRVKVVTAVFYESDEVRTKVFKWGTVIRKRET